MQVLVTGGAGYIGSVVTEELLNHGHQVIVIDNLQQGHRDAIDPRAVFHRVDLLDLPSLSKIFCDYRIEAVVHLAAETVVAASMVNPGHFFLVNITGGLNLLGCMTKYHVAKIVFSSSAAIYGEPLYLPLDEDHPRQPVNPYGESKLVFERILKWYEKAYGIKSILLRYFNAAGASRRCGEDHRPETHLIPNILKNVLDSGRPMTIYGNDYPTRDGTCVRDFVHVEDIARAHILALSKLDELGGRAYNLGCGKGFSVLEVLQTARSVTGKPIPVTYLPRRPGDPAVLLADPGRAHAELGWNPEFTSLESIIGSAWDWLKSHPGGYGPRKAGEKEGIDLMAVDLATGQTTTPKP